MKKEDGVTHLVAGKRAGGEPKSKWLDTLCSAPGRIHGGVEISHYHSKASQLLERTSNSYEHAMA